MTTGSSSSRRRQILVALLLILVSTQTAAQITLEFAVDDPIDAEDAVPGDGTCATAGGTCTLRAAFEESKAMEESASIELPAGVYVLTLGGLVWPNGSRTMTINGAGREVTIIDANGGLGIWMRDGTSLTARGITVRHSSGTAISVSSGTLLLEQTAIVDNSGGGVGAARSVNIVDSEISRNLRGGISNGEGTVRIVRSRIADNRAVSGAGIVGRRTRVMVEDSVIEGNVAFGEGLHGDGGGIENNLGFVQVVRSTIANNSAAQAGGGIRSQYGPIYIINSTVSGNTAREGGGLYYGQYGSQRPGVILRNATITQNHAEQRGGGIRMSTYSDFLEVTNTILWGNTDGSGDGPNCSLNPVPQLTMRSGGYNIFGDLTGCPVPMGVAGDITGDPLLGSLADNGGMTQTHALLPGSPAVNAGNPRGCYDENGLLLETDQRGVPRPQDGRCDIGAFEVEGEAPHCDDGDPCTQDRWSFATGCVNQHAPRTGCFAAERSSLWIENVSAEGNWKWSWNGTLSPPILADHVGKPTETTDLGLCFYGLQMADSVRLPAGAGWRKHILSNGLSFASTNRSFGRASSAFIRLRFGNTSRVRVRGKGIQLTDAPILASPLVVQLVAERSANCFSSTFEHTDAVRDDAQRLVARFESGATPTR